MKKAIIMLAALAIAQVANATALTAARDTASRAGVQFNFSAKSGSVYYAGGMLAIDSSGEPIPATDASGNVVIGRIEESLDASGANYKSTQKVDAQRGVFRWVNGATITAAEIGDLGYVLDDQTITRYTGTTYGVVAGRIVDVDDSGVWVDTADKELGAVPSIAASGNAAIGGNLSVSGTSLQTGNAVFSDALNLAGAATMSNNLSVAGTVTVGSALVSHGSATFGNVLLTNQISIATALNQSGDTSTGISAVLTNLPAGSTEDATYIKAYIGSTLYVIPAFAQP